MADDNDKIVIEGAQIIFRNFRGEVNAWNEKADRTFSVLIDPAQVDDLRALGWNVKELKSKEEGEPSAFHLPVRVNFKAFPPRVVLLTENSRARQTEETVGTIDYAELKNVDLVIRAYDWEWNGKTGRKAYLQTMFALIDEDPLERKYGIED